MMSNAKTVIVTGASGFIGTHLVNKLLELNFNIIAVTRRIKKEEQGKCNNILWVEWSNLCDILSSTPTIPDAIIHLATAYGRNGEDFLAVEEANVMLPLQLLHLAVKHNIKKFINTDSYFGKPEFNYQYMRPYIITKDDFRHQGQIIATQSDLHFISMRLEHVYGPGDGKDKFIPYIVESLLANKEFIECTDCTQKRDFIYVDDVVSAFITVLNENFTSNYLEFEVGSGTSVSVKEFVGKIKENIPTSNSIFLFGSIAQRENEILESKANNLSLTHLDWKNYHDINSGIIKMLHAWF